MVESSEARDDPAREHARVPSVLRRIRERLSGGDGPPAPRRVRLPDGTDVFATHADEMAVLYRQIFVERPYERHGISLPRGATVFDVGANVGLFGVHLARHVPDLRLVAFEPVPELFEALARNLRDHVPGGRARRLGIADRRGESVFEIDRFATYMATMHPSVFEDGARKDAGARAWARAGLSDLEKVTRGRAIVGALRRSLDVPVLGGAALAAVASLHLAMRARRSAFLRHVRCPLDSLSGALAESGFDRVDLVKIDVEGAEEEALAGVAEADWPRIRQLVVEVHDVDGRLDRMARTLESRGYRTTRDREDWAVLDLLGIHMLYAVRTDGATGDARIP